MTCKIIALLLSVILAVPARATKLNGHPTLTFDDLWYAGIEWELSAQSEPFETELKLDHAVKTKKVQLTYHCLRCDRVTVEINADDGKPLIPPLRMHGNVASRAAELEVDSRSVSSLHFRVMSTGRGWAEIQMIGAEID
jgi:hypothetical protein